MSRSTSDASDDNKEDPGTPTPESNLSPVMSPSTATNNDNPSESQRTPTIEQSPATDVPSQPDEMAQPSRTEDKTDMMDHTEQPVELTVDGFIATVSSLVMSDNGDVTLNDTPNSGSSSIPSTQPVQGRIPAKLPPVSISARKLTAPTLVAGKSTAKNTHEHSDSSETGEPSPKRRNTNGRTKKYKQK